MRPFQPTVVRGFSKYTRMTMHELVGELVARRAEAGRAYSSAATGSWIEHGPDDDDEPVVLAAEDAATASRPRLIVAEPRSVRGSSSRRMAGGSSGRKLSMRRSRVRWSIRPPMIAYGRPAMPRIGVISDTHGLVRPEALRALEGTELIVHAGDVGGPAVLTALRALAPVVAVRGNNDRGAWADALELMELVPAGGRMLYVLHDLHDLGLDPRAAGVAAVIAGHSHQPRIERRDGVLYLNPGSAGPRRFRLPVSVARLDLSEDRLEAEIVSLDV